MTIPILIIESAPIFPRPERYKTKSQCCLSSHYDCKTSYWFGRLSTLRNKS